MVKDAKALANRLEKLLKTSLAGGISEPPRLVRANSAFDLYKALKRVEDNPALARFLSKAR